MLRAVTFPVVHVADWKAFREACGKAWKLTTNAANWMITEMYARDVRRVDQEKLPAMPKVYLYPETSAKFPELPSRSRSCLEQAVGKKYRAKRFDVVWTAGSSLPMFRYPVPFPASNQAWSAWIENDQPYVSVALVGTERQTMRLKGGPRYRRQLAAFRQIASGLAVPGQMDIYKQGDDVMCKMVAWLPRPGVAKGKSGVLFVRSAPDALLVSLDGDGERLWAIHFDHVRRWAREHAWRLQRLSYDSKMEERKPGGPTFQQRREGYSEKYHDRMDSAAKEAASQVARYAERNRFATVQYNDSDKSFCEKFTWFGLRERLKTKLDEIGIEFIYDESPVPGVSEMEAVIKLNRKDERGKRWLRKAEVSLRAASALVAEAQ